MFRRIPKWRGLAAMAALAPLASTAPAQTAAPAEFRGVWIATVFGLDFPDAAGTSNITNQRAKLVELINAAENAGCNSILFQVRAECDAMYYSNYEPWSRWLTGSSGTAPARPWDPLQFVIDECRRRGMEVEAWFNPYRAGVSRSASYHATHPVNDMSSIVVNYNSGASQFYWLNPGHPQTSNYNSSVVLDLVSRYDVDAIHFDDYFYPYSISGANPFPDTAEYSQYGGGLSIGDWRRKNINDFVDRIKDDIATLPGKGHVRFGIAPFGIWQPGNPAGISGLNAYSSLFADSRKWLQMGWVDYLAPQLYWGRVADGYSSGQSFDALLGWWSNGTQNPLGRNVYAGVSPGWITPASEGYDAADVISQVAYTQSLAAAKGNIHFRAEMLGENAGAGRGNYSSTLASGAYSRDATIPASPWLDAIPPAAPTVAWSGSSGSGYTLHWKEEGTEYPQWYIAYWQTAGIWNHRVLPDWQRSFPLPGTGGSAPTNVAVAALDRVGNRSATTVFSLASPSGPIPPPFQNSIVRDGDTLDFVTGSGSNLGVTTSADSSTTEEINNRIDPRVASVGSASRKISFTWTAPNGLYRISTAGANPMISLTTGLGVYVKLLAGEIDVAVGIRETGGSGPIGGIGTTAGPIEATRKQRIKASPNWQYVYFDIPDEVYTSFASGNGVLDGSWGVLESFLVYRVGSDPTTVMNLYIDEICQSQPHMSVGEPPRVGRLAANAVSSTTVSLEWKASTVPDLKGHRIYRSTSANPAPIPGNRVAEVGALTSYSDTGRLPQTTYHYVVTAVDVAGYESYPSSEASATTPAAQGPLDAFAIR